MLIMPFTLAMGAGVAHADIAYCTQGGQWNSPGAYYQFTCYQSYSGPLKEWRTYLDCKNVWGTHEIKYGTWKHTDGASSIAFCDTGYSDWASHADVRNYVT